MSSDPNPSLGYRSQTQAPAGAFAEVDTRAVFGQTMGLVAITIGFFALGAYIGRDISGGTGIILMLVGFVPLIALQFAVRRGNQSLAIALLFTFGLLFGLGLAPIINYYASAEPGVVYQAGGATALFVAGFGAYGYATKRDLAMLGRIAFFALLGLIVFGIVLIFVTIPGGNLIYAILGLVVFAALTMFDFNRLKRSGIEMAPLLAASIFLDAVNIFLFFLQIFGGGGSRN
jgi:FtsH-binding integral membrane protein